MKKNTEGFEKFVELCENLIEEEFPYLYPEIGRTRSTDWMVHIFEHHDEPRRKLMAQGQADTLNEACQMCVDDYHKRKAIEDRKEELLKEPLVVEALKLFVKS